MFPDQQNQNGGVNSAPQRNEQGRYEVVPPLPTQNNAGHSGHNPYEFIVNPNQPSKRAKLPGGSNSLIIKLAVISVAAVLLMIVIAIIMSVLGPKSDTPGLESIAQQQEEIVRIASEGQTNASGQDTKNLAANVAIAVTSSQNELVKYLASNGVKMSDKQLAVGKNTQTDTLLTNAAGAGNYDSVLSQTLSSQIETYEAALQKAFKDTNEKQARSVLQDCFSSADKLQAQARMVLQ